MWLRQLLTGPKGVIDDQIFQAATQLQQLGFITTPVPAPTGRKRSFSEIEYVAYLLQELFFVTSRVFVPKFTNTFFQRSIRFSQSGCDASLRVSIMQNNSCTDS